MASILSNLSHTAIVGVAFTFFLTLILANKYAIYKRQKRFAVLHGCQPIPALPLRDPFFGLDEIRAKMKAAKSHTVLERMEAQYKSTGNTFSSKAFGVPLIHTIEPENVKTVLSLKFKDFGLGSREKSMGKLLGRGIFTSDGESWSHSRAMIRPNFVREQVADLDAFERHIQILFKLLPRDGTTVDLQEYFFKFTIDSATEFLFGTSTATLKAELNHDHAHNTEENFAKSFNIAQDFITMRSRLGKLRSVYFDRNADKAIKACHEFVDRYVEEAVQYRKMVDDLEKKGGHRDEKYVFLHELARQITDKKQLRDELLNVLLAGRDTTASLLSNMWHQVSRRPEIFAKLKAEVEDTLQGRLPTYQELRNMKYLKYCMNESLRLHPVVPANGRIAYHDTFLPLGGGSDGKSPVFVPAGTVVVYTPYVMHRRPDYFGNDADEYKPERWENLRPGWEYLPFNGGPRICLGQQYALTEAAYVTVRLLQEFSNVESRDPEPWAESLTLTMCSKNGALVGLSPA